MPTNRKKTTEENQNNPPVDEEKVPICIWIYKKDRDMFRDIPVLKNTMAKEGREFYRSFGKENGYADMNLARKIDKEHQLQRESNKRLYIMKIKQRQDLDDALKEGEDIMKEGTSERIIYELIIDMAHDNWNRFKNEENIHGHAELEPKPAWLKQGMDRLKKVSGFDKNPSEVQNIIMEVTPNKQEQWDEEYEQERDKHLSRRRG